MQYNKYIRIIRKDKVMKKQKLTSKSSNTQNTRSFRLTSMLLCLILTASILFTGCSFRLSTGLGDFWNDDDSQEQPNSNITESTDNTKDNADDTENGQISTTVIVPSTESSGVVTDLTEMIKEVMPAMVSITVKATTIVNGIFGSQQEYETQGSGSGIIIAQNESVLYIATNHHVIDGAKEILVTFANNKTIKAEVKGSDSDYDLAVLTVKLNEIEAETLNSIKCIAIGSSETLNLGEPAIAIGNALGYGQSVTVGYISALAREVKMEDNTMTLLQTDAAINPGNSGGALLNLRGQLIGINSAKFASTEVEGMGFAIPISDAIPIINDIINEIAIPENEQGYLGISGSTVNASWISYYGWPQGVYISSITKGSPADNSGMKAHDIIVKYDGRDIASIDSLTERLKKKRAGETVDIVIMRQDNYGKFEEKTLKVTLGNRPES